jgi:hypothetical protein
VSFHSKNIPKSIKTKALKNIWYKEQEMEDNIVLLQNHTHRLLTKDVLLLKILLIASSYLYKV